MLQEKHTQEISFQERLCKHRPLISSLSSEFISVCACVCVDVLFWSPSSVCMCISLFTAWGLISCRSCWLVPLTSGLEEDRQAGRLNRGYSFFISTWSARSYEEDLRGPRCGLCTLGLHMAVILLLWLYLFKALCMLVFLPLSLVVSMCFLPWTDVAKKQSMSVTLLGFLSLDICVSSLQGSEELKMSCV